MPDSPDRDLIRQQLDQILSSPEFRESQRMSRFLRFVVERSLAGESHNVKEYLIGIEVFDRKQTYDPRVDPIVRVEARRLRAKLGTYYKNQGKDTPVRIALPTGAYVPTFSLIVRETPPPPVPTFALRRTIAVLPFTNLTSGSGSEYFSDGLTEELGHLLTKIPQLQVVAWSSAVRMKGREDLADVVEQLAADSLLRGSVRRSGNRVRITAQLVDTFKGLVLWSASYDRELEDIFTVQDDIAVAIASALQLQMIEPVRVRPATPKALDSYNLYLKGRYYWNTRTPENVRRSLECFQQSVDADETNALPHSGLADAYTILVDHGALSSDNLTTAEEAARKAMELDPMLAEPYATLALIRSIYWHWDEAESLYRRALQLNPSYATAHHWLGCDWLSLHGRFEEAERSLETARCLDPLSSIVFESTATLYILWGRFDDAFAMCQEVLRRDPDSARVLGALGRLYTQRGEYDCAIESFRAGLFKNPETPSMLGALGQTLGLAGRPEEARGILARLTTLAERRHVTATSFAMVHLGLGEYSQAVEWLQLAAARHDPPVVSAAVHPAYRPLRDLSGFPELIEKIHLTGAWERAESYRKSQQ